MEMKTVAQHEYVFVLLLQLNVNMGSFDVSRSDGGECGGCLRAWSPWATESAVDDERKESTAEVGAVRRWR